MACCGDKLTTNSKEVECVIKRNAEFSGCNLFGLDIVGLLWKGG